ncbi:hypothetical protein TELCIR_02246 [Teladorsagia circumcincta]|uniref:Amino acid permease/ SLC12A domain-containing protein n=1 Tax=Teladorsagia circumcincta TaxID=45464 RepID=A0A2G9UZM4_TELCI|nr:hypothetical protein TELCIR_02246 [Teladorsagia circumcincta]
MELTMDLALIIQSMRNIKINPDAAFADAFDAKGATVAKYIITVGALAGMFNNLLSGIFALPRCVYAMADDGLLFTFLASINRFTKVPLNAVIVFTFINAVIALVFDLATLVDFLSIGTLSAYSMVTACVLILRYQAAPIDDSDRLDTGLVIYFLYGIRHSKEGRKMRVVLAESSLSTISKQMNGKT